MNYLLCSVGTFGDLKPFLEIGQRLQQRGHRVQIASPEPCRSQVERAQLPFVPTLSAKQYRSVLVRPQLWEPHGFFRTIVHGFMLPTIEPLVSWAQSEANGENLTMVADFGSGPAAQIVHETTGAQISSVWLSPSALQSEQAPPIIAGFKSFRHLPGPLKRLGSRILYRAAERTVTPPLNQVRKRWGLKANPSPLRSAVSKHLSLALYPEWFCPRQADDPPNLKFAGFPLGSGSATLPRRVENFLGNGPPPIVVTFGTGMMYGENEFEVVLSACQKLGLRTILISPNANLLIHGSDERILRADFLPFAELLCRAAAVVHHGGIGTAAQALSSGVPQLIIPLAHDQPDNAHRLTQLGVARSIGRRSLTRSLVGDELAHVLSPQVKSRASRLAQKVKDGGDAVGLACDFLEL